MISGAVIDLNRIIIVCELKAEYCILLACYRLRSYGISKTLQRNESRKSLHSHHIKNLFKTKNISLYLYMGIYIRKFYRNLVTNKKLLIMCGAFEIQFTVEDY